MALVTVESFSGNGGEVTGSYAYDDVSRVVQSLTVANDGERGTLTVRVVHPTNGNVLRSVTRNVGTGSFTRDLSDFGVQMVQATDRSGNPALRLPFRLEWVWSSV